MMKDRLQEFRDRSLRYGKGLNGTEPSGSRSDEICWEKNPLLYSPEDWNGVEQFLNGVEAFQNDLHLLETYARDVNQKHSEILLKPQADQKTKDELQQAIAAFKALSESLRISLKKSELETEAMRKERKAKGHLDPDAIDFRIRNTHIHALTKQLMEIISRFSNDQVTFRERCEKRIRDYLNLTGGSVDKSEFDEMVESGNLYQYAGGILSDTKKAKDVLREVEERYEDIKQTERLIGELQQLFIDLATLVQQQGDQVDSIEMHVMSAVDYSERAHKNMQDAEAAKRRYRRRKVILVIVILIVLLIVGAVIAIAICLESDKC